MEAIYRDAYPDVFATFGCDEPSKYKPKDSESDSDLYGIMLDVSLIRLEDDPNVD